jgi:hypothetical protein
MFEFKRGDHLYISFRRYSVKSDRCQTVRVRTCTIGDGEETEPADDILYNTKNVRACVCVCVCVCVGRTRCALTFHECSEESSRFGDHAVGAVGRGTSPNPLL